MTNVRSMAHLIRDRRGAALPLALIVLAVATLFVIPLLRYADTVLRQGTHGDGRIETFYSTDSGMSDGMAWLTSHWTKGQPSPTPPSPYSVTVNGVTSTVSIVKYNPINISQYSYADIVLALETGATSSTATLQYAQNLANALVDTLDLHDNGNRLHLGITRFQQCSASVMQITKSDTPLPDHPTDNRGNIDYTDSYFPQNVTGQPSVGCNGDASSLYASSDVPLHAAVNDLELNNPDLTSTVITNGHAYTPGNTNIVAGLEGASAQYASGLGDRPGVPNLMLVVLAGNDSYATTTPSAGACDGSATDPITQASSATAADDIFAIGLGGTGVTANTLNAIAKCSSYASGVPHVFRSNAGSLKNLVGQLIDAINASSLSGTLYSVTSTASDGSTVQADILLTFGGQVVVLSWQ